MEIGEAGDVLELGEDLTLEIIAPPKGTNKDSLPEVEAFLKRTLHEISEDKAFTVAVAEVIPEKTKAEDD